NTKGTGIIPDAEIADKIGNIFDLRPAAIIRKFGLKNPIYGPTAAYGHFGREPYTKVLELTRGGKTVKEEVQFFGWEKLDSVDLIRTEFGL
ncbi:MAG: methionine adenosyltransferase domain-containing protein, partial [Bacteroidales bacterium]|nr:methionine adenosyltransferase domain-containing protein [Bacteroidales bacterium]